MPLLPGHNYLGPGNNLNNGEPVDEDDRIAQEHDIAYSNAVTFNDVQTADLNAVKKFGKEALLNFNPHAAIGAIGLLPKVVQQHLTGTVPKSSTTFGNLPVMAC